MSDFNRTIIASVIVFVVTWVIVATVYLELHAAIPAEYSFCANPDNPTPPNMGCIYTRHPENIVVTRQDSQYVLVTDKTKDFTSPHLLTEGLLIYQGHHKQ